MTTRCSWCGSAPIVSSLNVIRGERDGLASVKFPAARQSIDDRLHPLRSGFWLLRGLEPVSYGVQVGLVERCKEGIRLLVSGKLLQEIVRHGGAAEGIIGGLPSAVGLC